MKTKLEPNKKLFTIFLLINAAGYNYENNPGGMHPLRKHFRKVFRDSLGADPVAKRLVKPIRSMPLVSDEYIRLANLVMLPQEYKDIYKDRTKSRLINQIWNKELLNFNKILESTALEKLFSDYCDALETIPTYETEYYYQQFKKVLDFFHLSENIPLNINVHLNLLDSYSRGTNYFTPKDKYISCSLDYNNEISWKTVRHEFMHIILKQVFKDDLSNRQVDIPVNKNYANESLRVKFDENFVLAANSFFLKTQTERVNNLKYINDHGYKKIYHNNFNRPCS